MSDWQQLTIVHLTDLHFGAAHRFRAAGGGAGDGIPTLSQSILKDLVPQNFPELEAPALESGKPPGDDRVIVALTGDFNERSVEPEFRQASEFLQSLYGKWIFGRQVSASEIFLVPGNHDLKYAEGAIDDRWFRYCQFYQDHEAQRAKIEKRQPTLFDARHPIAFSRIIDQSARGLIVAEINSSAYVQQGTEDERRGQVDQGTINRLRDELNAIADEARHNSIKIALVHHHPVLLPVLTEDDRGYDAILNGELLLNLLKEYGFHIVLHGHKHNPYTFSYDAVCAWMTDDVHPLLVIAGGSAGSTGLPEGPSATNTYNIIRVKWQPGARQARVHVESRGLERYDSRRRVMEAPRWHWKTLRVDDRVLTVSRPKSNARGALRERTAEDQKYDDQRSRAIEATRRNFPAIEVFPSLIPGQGFEARVWIESQATAKPPVRVEWAASPAFFPEVHVCKFDADPQFQARFAYYGPTLIQARLFWDDGYEAVAHIFARYPRVD